MLPAGERPLLERTIQQPRRSGSGGQPDDARPGREHRGGNRQRRGIRIKSTHSERGLTLWHRGGLNLGHEVDGREVPIMVISSPESCFRKNMARFYRKCGARHNHGGSPQGMRHPRAFLQWWNARMSGSTTVREKPLVNSADQRGMHVSERTAIDFIPAGERLDIIRTRCGRWKRAPASAESRSSRTGKTLAVSRSTTPGTGRNASNGRICDSRPAARRAQRARRWRGAGYAPIGAVGRAPMGTARLARRDRHAGSRRCRLAGSRNEVAPAARCRARTRHRSRYRPRHR